MPMLTPKFDPAVFACKDGSETPKHVVAQLEKLFEQLITIKNALEREHKQSVQIEVTSGYRSPEYNKKVGGAPKSEHMSGMAADIKVHDIPPSAVADTIDELQKDRLILRGGLGRYDTFTHYDIRGYFSRWDERKRPMDLGRRVS